jgi:hypothetical protein
VDRSASEASAGSNGADVASTPSTTDSCGAHRTATRSTWVRSSAVTALVAATNSTIS